MPHLVAKVAQYTKTQRTKPLRTPSHIPTGCPSPTASTPHLPTINIERLIATYNLPPKPQQPQQRVHPPHLDRGDPNGFDAEPPTVIGCARLIIAMVVVLLYNHSTQQLAAALNRLDLLPKIIYHYEFFRRNGRWDDAPPRPVRQPRFSKIRRVIKDTFLSNCPICS